MQFLSSGQGKSQIKLTKSEEEALQTNAVDAAALDFSPLSSYGKDGIKQLLKTAVLLGAKYGEHLDLSQHIGLDHFGSDSDFKIYQLSDWELSIQSDAHL